MVLLINFSDGGNRTAEALLELTISKLLNRRLLTCTDMTLFGRHRAEIDERLWQRLLHDYPFIQRHHAAHLTRLRLLSNQFLQLKQFYGAQGLIVDNYIGAAIALQASLPICKLGMSWYDDFTQIIVYPDQFLVRNSVVDADGISHESEDALSGQTIADGPVVLSWSDAHSDQATGTYNVVIHEFIHKLDLRDGIADGCPPLPRGQRQLWLAALHHAWQEFVGLCNQAAAAVPASVDPDSAAADSYFAHLPLDPYAATDPAEFFAVLGEVFFTDPLRLRQSFDPMQQHFQQFFVV